MNRLSILVGFSIISLALVACNSGPGPDPSPDPLTVSIESASSEVIAGGDLELRAVTAGAGNETATLRWSADGGTFSSSSGAETVWTAPTSGGGSYLLRVSATANGVEATDSLEVRVTPAANGELALTVTPAAERVGIGNELKFEASVTGDAASDATVDWSANGGAGSFTLAQGRQVSWEAPLEEGTYSITATASAGSVNATPVTVEVEVTLCNEGEHSSRTAPCVISNVHQLQRMNEHLEGHFRLGADIDASATANWEDGGFTPVGPRASPENEQFRGTLDGQQHEISGLRIERSRSGYAGLFGVLGENAEVTGVALTDVRISNRGSYTGALAGGSEGGKISDSRVVGGEVQGEFYTGGLIGEQSGDGTIERSFVRGVTVVGARHVGGLVGRNSAGYVADSYTLDGSVEGTNQVGGLIGRIPSRDGVAVENSYSVVDVHSGGEQVGALIGVNEIDPPSNVVASFWSSDLSNQTSSEGGSDISASEMRTRATFEDAGWEFSGQNGVWEMGEHEPGVDPGTPNLIGNSRY